MQEAVRWKTQADGKRQGWGHVQFAAAASVAAALELSGQSLMGRALEVHQADEATGGNEAARLNLGQPVKDCWFCLSNEEVRTTTAPRTLREAPRTIIASDPLPARAPGRCRVCCRRTCTWWWMFWTTHT